MCVQVVPVEIHERGEGGRGREGGGRANVLKNTSDRFHVTKILTKVMTMLNPVPGILEWLE